MTTTKQLAKKLLEARGKATDGPWSYDADENEIHSDTMENSCGDPAQICEMLKPRMLPNADFITQAANHITELCTAYLKLEKQLEVCKEQRNGWLRKYWENEKLSTEIVEASIKEISERKDQELEKVEW